MCRRMVAVGPTSDPGVTADFPWVTIAAGKDGIVDVGGGQGTLCCSLAAKYARPVTPADLALTRLDILKLNVSLYRISQKLGKALKPLSDPKDWQIEFSLRLKTSLLLSRGKANMFIFCNGVSAIGLMYRIECIFLLTVLHDWSTERGAEILKQIHDVLNEDVISFFNPLVKHWSDIISELPTHYRHCDTARCHEHCRPKFRRVSGEVEECLWASTCTTLHSDRFWRSE